MIPRTLAWIAQATGGRLLNADPERSIDAVVIDSRALPQDRQALFIALKGENFDGHDHVADAIVGGCVAAIVSRRVDADLPQLLVADTEHALAAIAAAMQVQRPARVLAITGSNGKTTIKAMLLSILQRCGKAYANPGNRNNQIGLPLAVIDAPEDADFAIYEMGAGKPGDIAYLTGIARPDVALVNNIAPAHLERLGSLLGVADTKAAIYDALPGLDDERPGVAVINADDAFAPYFMARAGGRRMVRVGLDASAEIGARDIQADSDCTRFTLVVPEGAIAVTLPMPGRHNLRNALAAAGMARAAGASLEQIRVGLDTVQPVAGRQLSHRLRGGTVLIDDSYNANPGSLEAAIEALAGSGDQGWLVLGDMRELGEEAAILHRQAGQRARAAGVARLYALGSLSMETVQGFGAGARHFLSPVDLVDALIADLAVHSTVDSPVSSGRGTRILVKGSRGSAMDRIVESLLRHDASAGQGEVDAA